MHGKELNEMRVQNGLRVNAVHGRDTSPKIRKTPKKRKRKQPSKNTEEKINKERKRESHHSDQIARNEIEIDVKEMAAGSAHSSKHIEVGANIVCVLHGFYFIYSLL